MVYKGRNLFGRAKNKNSVIAELLRYADEMELFGAAAAPRISRMNLRDACHRIESCASNASIKQALKTATKHMVRASYFPAA